MESYEFLEARFGQWTGYAPEQMVACSSGSAALHLALEALYVNNRHRVVVPDFAMVACARAVTLAGAVPVFVDCDDRLLIDNQKIPNVGITAIMPVHIYGRICNVDQIRKRHGANKIIIEDMAEAHGVKPHPETDAACWSFYRNKIVCGEEGGMVAFRNPTYAARARQLRSHGFTEAHDFQHIPRGMNYRLSNVHARMIFNSLECVENNLEDRAKLESLYSQVISEYMPDYLMPSRDVVWVYDLRIPGMTHDKQRKIVLALNEQGIAARCAFYPLSQQPEYRLVNQNLGSTPSNAARLSQEVIYLPVSPLMTPDDILKNVTALRQLVN